MLASLAYHIFSTCFFKIQNDLFIMSRSLNISKGVVKLWRLMTWLIGGGAQSLCSSAVCWVAVSVDGTKAQNSICFSMVYHGIVGTTLIAVNGKYACNTMPGLCTFESTVRLEPALAPYSNTPTTANSWPAVDLHKSTIDDPIVDDSPSVFRTG